MGRRQLGEVRDVGPDPGRHPSVGLLLDQGAQGLHEPGLVCGYQRRRQHDPQVLDAQLRVHDQLGQLLPVLPRGLPRAVGYKPLVRHALGHGQVLGEQRVHESLGFRALGCLRLYGLRVFKP